MSTQTPPEQVWISWCDVCGKPDYAYGAKPKSTDGTECPRCNAGTMKIAGPYVDRGPSKLLKASAAVLELLDAPGVHIEAADDVTRGQVGNAMRVFRFAVAKAEGRAT